MQRTEGEDEPEQAAEVLSLVLGPLYTSPRARAHFLFRQDAAPCMPGIGQSPSGAQR